MKPVVHIIPQRGRGFAAALALACAWLFASALQPIILNAQEKSFLWKLSRGESSIYLLGSIHYLGKEHFPLRQSILDALDNSKKLVLEIDLNSASPETAQRVTLEKALYRDGTTLAQNIDPETYRLAAERAASLGLDMKVLSQMKPWFVGLTMMAFKLRQLGLDANLGVDRELAERAKQSGKPTGGLESIEFQLDLLDRLPKREQEMMLRESIVELERLDQNINEIVQAWLGGDGAAIERLLLAGMREYPELHQKLIVDRNRRWLPDIEKLIAQGGDAMVVVGAAHLVGQDGLIEMLKSRSYTMEQQ
jgi:uncharacterized protein YbaP (TraB family)